MQPGAPPFPKHFDGKYYFNPNAPQVRGFRELLRWRLNRRPQPSPRFIDDVTPSQPPAAVAGAELRVTLINHSTVLLQQSGCNILTDPIWSERATPVRGFGPRRKRIPGVRLQDLPRIDIVLISHNHYDHLDLAALRRLNARNQSQFVVPCGVARLLQSNKIGPVHELDWGDQLPLAGTVIHSVPALHFSARGLFDRNRTLWCGYVIEAAGRTIYFAADTAFGPHFAAIRERFGAPDLAFLPIGACEPRWFMSPVHMSPDDAMSAHLTLGAHKSIAIHHGTFQLADDSLDAPRQRIRECAPPEFLILNNGESITLA